MTSTQVCLLAMLFTIVSLSASAQEVAGREIQVRPALVSERGSHPRIVVETVKDATTTATCLALRYREPGKKSPSESAGHLLEHLLYRSLPGKKPGGLLLRNELLGDQNRAWVTPTEIVFSEVVPAQVGLESLKVQLSRLSGVPQDSEGLKFEKSLILSEIERSASPEELARRQILAGLGQPAQVEGNAQTIQALTLSDLSPVLSDLNMETDVVIAIVGPHTAREIRQALSQTLKPLSPQRQGEREATADVLSPLQDLSVASPSGNDQLTTFFEYPSHNSQLLAVAQALLDETLDPSSQSRLWREGQDLWRLDLSPADTDLSPALETLTSQVSEALFAAYRLSWLDRYESPERRSEMLALNTLRGKPPESLPTREEFEGLLKRSKELLRASQREATQLTLTPLDPANSRPGLFPFREVANRESSPALQNQKLPNQMTVSAQSLESWPTVAISGFFRISPPLSREQFSLLRRAFKERTDLKLHYHVKPNGLFFDGWAPAEDLQKLLEESALELQSLAESKEDLIANTKPSANLIEGFFSGPFPSETPVRRVRGRDIVNPRDGHLVVVGKIEAKALDKGLRPAWSGWFGDDRPKSISVAKPGADRPPLEESKIIPTERSDQPILLIGLEGPNRSSQDFLAFNLALQTLAGRPSTSLIARKLQQGSNAVTSVKLAPMSVSTHSDKQTWLIALRLTTPVEDPTPIVEKVEALVRALANSELAEAELKRTRGFLKNSLTLSGSNVRGRARVLAHAEFYRLSESYAQDFAGLYDNLTSKLVQSVCRTYLSQPQVRWLYFYPQPSQD